jgi:hypothetical protein
VSEQGRDLLEVIPSPLPFEPRAAVSAISSVVYDALTAFRDRVAARDDVQGSSLVGLDELRRIADDAPATVAELVPGRHGSGLFLARYGEEIVRTIADAALVNARATPKVRADADATLVAGLIRPGMSLRQLAVMARLTPPNAAHAIQRAIEAGLHVQRYDLIDDAMYSEVLAYVRHHRFAKLRHVREHVGEDVELADLRVALAFARHDLHDSTP